MTFPAGLNQLEEVKWSERPDRGSGDVFPLFCLDFLSLICLFSRHITAMKQGDCTCCRLLHSGYVYSRVERLSAWSSVSVVLFWVQLPLKWIDFKNAFLCSDAASVCLSVSSITNYQYRYRPVVFRVLITSIIHWTMTVRAAGSDPEQSFH